MEISINDVIMDLKKKLIERAETYCQQTGIAKPALAAKVVNDGAFFNRIESGAGCTIKTYERFMAFFDSHAAAPKEPASVD